MTLHQNPPTDSAATGITLEVWADVVCAWCYVGIHRLRHALEAFHQRADIHLQLRSFELEPEFHQDPSATTVVDLLVAQGLYSNRDSANRRFRYVTEAGAEEGIELCTGLARPTSSFEAHRLVHFAAEHGRGLSLLEHLMRAYHVDNHNLNEVQVLATAAQEVGLDSRAAHVVLDNDTYTTEVRTDEQRAVDLGIRTIPAFHISGSHLLEGVPTVADLRALLRRALRKQSPTQKRSSA